MTFRAVVENSTKTNWGDLLCFKFNGAAKKHIMGDIYKIALDKVLLNLRNNESADRKKRDRNDDDTLFPADSVININRRMLGVFVIDYPVIGFFNHSFVRHMPVFHYSTDSLAVLCKF